ncbi:MAG: hypothetical protein WDA70_11275 [Lysobacteraceae bacterium]|nr:hypothetical protein [Gammaproteobacteria bacterium]
MHRYPKWGGPHDNARPWYTAASGRMVTFCGNSSRDASVFSGASAGTRRRYMAQGGDFFVETMQVAAAARDTVVIHMLLRRPMHSGCGKPRHPHPKVLVDFWAKRCN